MPVETVEIGEPFFGITLLSDERRFEVKGRAIALNIGSRPLRVASQCVFPLRSVILQDTEICDVEACVLVHRFDAHTNEAETLTTIRKTWPSAFEVRGEERLRGIAHYMSPKRWIGQVGLTLYHAASVPLKVGLHRDHPFCPVPGFREIHTQILGLGKMQQCREQSLDTLYLEEIMAPGMTHAPMFDDQGNYPWHQYETITPSVFLAVEMLPEGASVPMGG